jgi:hypothetical protein
MRRHLCAFAHVCVLVGLMLWPAGGRIEAQEIAELVGPTAKIPRDSFKTWSLFLMCNPDWVSAEKSRDVENLYGRFRAFGDAIGKENLAVWFWRQKTRVNDPRLAENIDVARSAEYCSALGLKPSLGPYLVVTNSYPDLAAFPRDRAIFELGGGDPAALAKLLNALTDQLLLEKKVDAARLALEKAAPPAKPPTTPAPAATQPVELSLWIQLLEAGRRSIIGLGCAVKLSISAGPLNAELRGCA